MPVVNICTQFSRIFAVLVRSIVTSKPKIQRKYHNAYIRSGTGLIPEEIYKTAIYLFFDTHVYISLI
jgi:hypothetical protein